LEWLEVLTAGDPTLHGDMPDERDTRSAFPSHLGKADFGAFVWDYVEKFNWSSRTGYTRSVLARAKQFWLKLWATLVLNRKQFCVRTREIAEKARGAPVLLGTSKPFRNS
jgi:hypothetical protein